MNFIDLLYKSYLLTDCLEDVGGDVVGAIDTGKDSEGGVLLNAQTDSERNHSNLSDRVTHTGKGTGLHMPVFDLHAGHGMGRGQIVQHTNIEYRGM